MADLLYQRLGVAVNRLAQDLMSRKAGDRIPSVSEYEEILQVSRGTVQNSVTYLKEKGAISLISRGYLGTYIEKINYRCLQECTFKKELLGAMPLPYSLSYQGFATALYQVFSPLTFNLVYARGAESRLRLISADVCQFIICSRYTAEEAVRTQKDVEIVMDFGPGSYLSSPALVLRDSNAKGIESGMRVAYDRTSPDQQHITELVCKGVDDVEYVEIHAHQTISAIRSGLIDAGIWNMDEILESGHQDLNIIPLDNFVDVSAYSTATVLVRKGDSATKQILEHYLDKDIITGVQNDVKQGKIPADY